LKASGVENIFSGSQSASRRLLPLRAHGYREENSGKEDRGEEICRQDCLEQNSGEQNSASVFREEKHNAREECWPGFEPVPGKQPMTEGSCRPKPHQTSAEKKADSRAAAGSKLQKAGGEKAKANRN
jgi:hypothetical protein